MNDLMHHVPGEDSELEQRLREALGERALMARPSPDARAAVRARVAERRSGRRVRRGLGAAAAAAAAVGGGLWLQTGSPVTVGLASGGDPTSTTVAAQAQPAPASSPLPRLVLDGEGFFVEHADEYRSDPSLGETGDVYVQVFRAAGQGPASPSFTITSVAIGATYGIGEEAPAEVTRIVDVRGRRGYLVEGNSFSPSLGWRLEDGSAVHLKSIGVGGDGLVDIANSLEPRGEEFGWDVTIPTAPQVVEGHPTHGAGASSSEVQYRTDRGVRADVRLIEGDQLHFEQLILDRADAAQTMEPIEVRGHQGVMFGTGASFVVVWQDSDAIVGEVVLVMPRDEALATLATLHEIPEEEWHALP